MLSFTSTQLAGLVPGVRLLVFMAKPDWGARYEGPPCVLKSKETMSYTADAVYPPRLTLTRDL